MASLVPWPSTSSGRADGGPLAHPTAQQGRANDGTPLPRLRSLEQAGFG